MPPPNISTRAYSIPPPAQSTKFRDPLISPSPPYHSPYELGDLNLSVGEEVTSREEKIQFLIGKDGTKMHKRLINGGFGTNYERPFSLYKIPVFLRHMTPGLSLSLVVQPSCTGQKEHIPFWTSASFITLGFCKRGALRPI